MRTVLWKAGSPMQQGIFAFVVLIDVIGNHCGTDYPDCSLFVKNTYCDHETERCRCKEGFTVNNLTKLCEGEISTLICFNFRIINMNHCLTVTFVVFLQMTPSRVKITRQLETCLVSNVAF